MQANKMHERVRYFRGIHSTDIGAIVDEKVNLGRKAEKFSG